MAGQRYTLKLTKWEMAELDDMLTDLEGETREVLSNRHIDSVCRSGINEHLACFIVFHAKVWELLPVSSQASTSSRGIAPRSHPRLTVQIVKGSPRKAKPRRSAKV